MPSNFAGEDVQVDGQSAVVSEKTVDGERACLVYIPRGRNMIRFG
jgi:hypothetical protein